MNRCAAELADRIDAAVPAWVEGCVARVMGSVGAPVNPEVTEAARMAGRRAGHAVASQIRLLLEADIDHQRSTPLAILRARAVPFPTEILRAAGVAPTARDRVAEAMFPDDPYDLGPTSFADLGAGVAEAGMAWGAAKAFEHQSRYQGARS